MGRSGRSVSAVGWVVGRWVRRVRICAMSVAMRAGREEGVMDWVWGRVVVGGVDVGGRVRCVEG